jgi:hypothetical protein
LLRHIERRASILRALAILKIRDDDYDRRVREIAIGEQGIRLLDTFAHELDVISGGGGAADPRRDREP